MPYADPQSEKAKECQRKASRKYYSRNREREVRRSARWAKDNAAKVNKTAVRRRSERLPPEKVLYNNAKNRAKAKALEFDVTPEDLAVPDRCPVLGIKLQVGVGHARPNSPSVDRIDPVRGYVRGNVRVISHKANTIKSNATIHELKAVLDYMEELV